MPMTRAGYFRPIVHHNVRITLDKDGYPAVWRQRIVTQTLMKGSPVPPSGGLDTSAVEGSLGSPYLKATPVVDAQLALPDVGVPVLWWRSVGATHTAYVMEHTIDQLARKAGKDPIEYRRTLYTRAGAKRHLAVMDLAIAKAGPAPAGLARGIAVHESFGSVVAQIADVDLSGAEPRVGRVVTAIDCGTAIAPNQIAAQMEGGTCYGLSAVLQRDLAVEGAEAVGQAVDQFLAEAIEIVGRFADRSDGALLAGGRDIGVGIRFRRMGLKFRNDEAP
eukprot:gene5065-6866_t